MKGAFVLIPLAAGVLVGCSATKTATQEPIERGWIDRSVLERPEHEAFKHTYDTVRVDSNVTTLLAAVGDGVEYLVLLGTWCSDSRREVPRFLKVLDQAGIPAGRVKLYGVDRTMKSSEGVPQRYNLERVPTFIMLKGGLEIGRITETPRTTIEVDLLTILAGAQRK